MQVRVSVAAPILHGIFNYLLLICVLRKSSLRVKKKIVSQLTRFVCYSQVVR